MKLIAMLHFEGRDEELAELVGCRDCNPDISHRPTEVVKGNIDAGRGIGKALIFSIMSRRRRLAGDAEADGNDQRGLIAIREAVATLKASGEHDRIIAEQASLAERVGMSSARCHATPEGISDARAATGYYFGDAARDPDGALA